MPDSEIFEFPVLTPKPDSASERLRNVLFEGIATGVTQRLSDPEHLALEAGMAFAGGAALKMMFNVGGRWAAAGKILAGGFTVAAASDITRRAIPTVQALKDSYHSNANLDDNKTTIAAYLGTGLVDYPLMALAGYGGLRAAGSFGNRTAMTLDLNQQVSANPAADALLQKGVAIARISGGAGTAPDIPASRITVDLKMSYAEATARYSMEGITPNVQVKVRPDGTVDYTLPNAPKNWDGDMSAHLRHHE